MARNYAAEYARRKALHPGNIGAARGHPSREIESTQRKLYRVITKSDVRVNDEGQVIKRGYEGGKRPSLRGVVTRENRGQIEERIRQVRQAQREYEKGNGRRGKALWESRDRDLPDWMFWYHGVYG